MKWKLRYIFLVCSMASICVQGVSAKSVVNKPVRFEFALGQHTSQMVFEFAHPLYYEKDVKKPGEEVRLYFPGMSLEDFKAVIDVDKIKDLPFVKSVSIGFERVPVSRVVLDISFIPDTVILRLTKMEDPNLLVVDIFDKKILEILRRKVTTTLYACNGAVKNDYAPILGAKKKRVLNPLKAHIVIDAGHGGVDSGASSFGLKEKNITLDIARRVYAQLKKEGYSVFLTRNSDAQLSVVDRFQLAQQLKADLFVSVHVNAVPGLGHVSGVETHFLDGAPFFSKKNRKSFLFAASRHDKQLAHVADKVLYDKITASKNLSSLIQKNILYNLKEHKVPIVNRGVKQTGFRTLLRSEVPSSIVEVGFITNKVEAKRFTKPWYRSILAQGISRGIKGFLAK